ncbi:MAG: Sec-independent protein translocase protein TatB [Candidatus Puniceispirillaceae bacterium]
MFDLGWQEFLMVAIVLMLVVGPKDMPRILRSFSQFMRKARSMASEFTTSLEDVARDEELQDMKSMMQDVKSGNFDEMANLIDSDLKQMAEDVKSSADFDDVTDDLKTIAPTSPKTKKAVQKAPVKKATSKKGASKKPAAKKPAAKKSAKKG